MSMLTALGLGLSLAVGARLGWAATGALLAMIDLAAQSGVQYFRERSQ